MKKWTIQESVKKLKLLNETVGMDMMGDLEELDLPTATERDYREFEECLVNYNIDEDVMDNANVFVNVQMNNLGMDDKNDPNYYTMRIGLISYNLTRNGYDVYNEDPSQGETCVMDIHNKFMPKP